MPNDRIDDVDENVAKADGIAGWLDGLGSAAGRIDRGAVAADLGDLYTSARVYRRLLDELLAISPVDTSAASEKLNEIGTELRHQAWHIRSDARRLDRIESNLDLGDEIEKGRGSQVADCGARTDGIDTTPRYTEIREQIPG